MEEYFHQYVPGSRDIKGRINKWDYIKLKPSSLLKKTSAKCKGNRLYGKVYSQMIPWKRVWCPKYIKNSHNSIPGRQTIQLKNGQRTWTDTSPRDILKNYSTSLAIKDMQIKTSVSYHFISVRIAIIDKVTNNKCCRCCGEKRTLVHCWWECRLGQPLWKTVWDFSRKLKVELSFDPAIPCLGLYPKNLETPVQKNLCTPVFIAELFIIAKFWKHPKYSLVNKWIKQVWHYLHNGILHSRKKEETPTLHYSMDGTGEY